ncbi:hypothetical protein [uncultured Nisaea sp.]|jgi:hypothetical protein|uniref:hypothetical protein n=1 Tax=uncultured Nisaea sp. TaxID=538215 RepID=UPI0030EB3B02|tara:strand:+ start:622 stop:999 length:378 start_codon:yes stop_codon:yes gene_type:complete
MPIQTLVEAGDLVVFRVDGLVTAEQAVAAIKNHYSRTPSKFCIWDLSGASLSEITYDRFQMIVEAVGEFADARGPGARTALVADGDLNPVLAKALAAQVQVSKLAIETRVFRDQKTARTWLQNPA